MHQRIRVLRKRIIWIDFTPFINSHQRYSVKKDAVKNFANVTRKHFCWSLLFNKLQVCRPTTLLKGDSNTGVFPMKVPEFSRTPILKNILKIKNI